MWGMVSETHSVILNMFLFFFNYDDVMTWEFFSHYCPFNKKNPPVIGGFPSQKANNAKLRCLFVVSVEMLLNKQLSCW